MLVVTPSLSAWSYAQAPALVTRLENGFLRSLQSALPTLSSVSLDTRASLSALLRRGASPRLLGDALYLGQMHQWAEARNRQLGAGTITIRFEGPERLFEPFLASEDALQPLNAEDFRRRFLEGFDRLDNVARAIVEIEGPAMAFARSGDELLIGGYFMYLAPLLRSFGIHIFNFNNIEDADSDSRFVFRHLSISALEMGLRVFVGDQSVRYCMAPGLVTERQNNDLHKMGYHPMGWSRGMRKTHGARQRPPIFMLHDAGHGAQWSVRVPAWMRVASALLSESIGRFANEHSSQKLISVREQLGDLELGDPADLGTVVATLKHSVPPDVYRLIAEDWKVRLGKAARQLQEDRIRHAEGALI